MTLNIGYFARPSKQIIDYVELLINDLKNGVKYIDYIFIIEDDKLKDEFISLNNSNIKIINIDGYNILLTE